MDISGVLVQARPEQVDAVKNHLSRLAGVEVHAVTETGRMVVTIENESAPMIETMNAFHNITGVLSTSLIYHHFDELAG